MFFLILICLHIRKSYHRKSYNGFVGGVYSIAYNKIHGGFMETIHQYISFFRNDSNNANDITLKGMSKFASLLIIQPHQG